jgi:hypothetical protein
MRKIAVRRSSWAAAAVRVRAAAPFAPDDCDNLMPEHRQRVGAGAIVFFDAVGEDPF